MIWIWIWSLLATVSAAVSVDDLVGTWTTKSQQVLTGPVRTLQNKHKHELKEEGILRSAQ
jgi:hypothetical protein